MNVGDFLIERLSDWGVTRIYGYPGDGINGIVGALSRAENQIEFVQVRHEETAAFMACAHAKFTGNVGVCLATSGPGAIHLLNGLYDAKLDHQPVVAIVGQQARAALGGSYQQEVDLVLALQRRGTRVRAPDRRPGAGSPPPRSRNADRARRADGHLPRHPERRPDDGCRRAARARARDHPLEHRVPRPRVVPHEGDLRMAAELLNGGERVAMLVGQGARRDRRGDRGGRAARGRHREGAAGEGGRSRRRALRHGIDRTARDEAELRPDDGLRHAARGRVELPVFRVPA